jgi:hypothetical protein
VDYSSVYCCYCTAIKKQDIMKAATFLASSLATAALALEFSNDGGAPPHLTLPKGTPIYVGEFVYSTGQNLITWLPTSNYCTMSTPFAEFSTFSVGELDPLAPRIDDLVFSGYTGARASITRSGKQFARCNVGPTSIKLGRCKGQDDDEADAGDVYLNWTCYVDESKEAQRKVAEEEQVVVPPNVAEPPKEFAGQEGTYQRWECDEKGCKAKFD